MHEGRVFVYLVVITQQKSGIFPFILPLTSSPPPFSEENKIDIHLLLFVKSPNAIDTADVLFLEEESCSRDAVAVTTSSVLNEESTNAQDARNSGLNGRWCGCNR